MPFFYNDDNFLDPYTLTSFEHARRITFDEALPILSSPDSGRALSLTNDAQSLTDGTLFYPLHYGLPLLYPISVLEELNNGEIGLDYYSDSIKQYYLLSQIKQRGEINAPSDSIHYQRHLFRMHRFLSSCTGSVLDVGCDNVDISSALFGKECTYVGLDPFTNDTSKFRVIGVGECLPFLSNSFDNVVFNTSLDHILDYHTAIEEAFRVLKPGGRLSIATLIWETNATLLSDSVHFHHFREYEIVGALQEKMNIIELKKYSYKNNSHRYSLFIAANKLQTTLQS